VTVNVTNTGDMLGTDTVQVYAGPLPVPVNTAPKALAGFGQVTLAPGESRDVTISLDPESLSYWDVEADQWQIADGDVPLMVGNASDDIQLTGTIAVSEDDAP